MIYWFIRPIQRYLNLIDYPKSKDELRTCCNFFEEMVTSSFSHDLSHTEQRHKSVFLCLPFQTSWVLNLLIFTFFDSFSRPTTQINLSVATISNFMGNDFINVHFLRFFQLHSHKNQFFFAHHFQLRGNWIHNFFTFSDSRSWTTTQIRLSNWLRNNVYCWLCTECLSTFVSLSSEAVPMNWSLSIQKLVLGSLHLYGLFWRGKSVGMIRVNASWRANLKGQNEFDDRTVSREMVKNELTTGVFLINKWSSACPIPRNVSGQSNHVEVKMRLWLLESQFIQCDRFNAIWLFSAIFWFWLSFSFSFWFSCNSRHFTRIARLSHFPSSLKMSRFLKFSKSGSRSSLFPLSISIGQRDSSQNVWLWWDPMNSFPFTSYYLRSYWLWMVVMMAKMQLHVFRD
jgi:hypothetical protein